MSSYVALQRTIVRTDRARTRVRPTARPQVFVGVPSRRPGAVRSCRVAAPTRPVVSLLDLKRVVALSAIGLLFCAAVLIVAASFLGFSNEPLVEGLTAAIR